MATLNAFFDEDIKEEKENIHYLKGIIYNMKRKYAFEQNKQLEHQKVVSKQPIFLYPQETDWTCSIACIRTLLSGILNNVPGEIEFIDKYNLIPGPYFSKDIKKLGILNEYDVVYGCDNKDKNFDMILDLMEDDYYIMLECVYNYGHWVVLLGYYPLQNCDIESSNILVYDPYYDTVRLLNVDEFITMWFDGGHIENGIKRDFIAVQELSLIHI